MNICTLATFWLRSGPMRILIAGSTGAIGQSLVDNLVYYGHEVFGLTQSEERASVLAARGAKPLVVNVMDKEPLFAAFAKAEPQMVIDMLTALPKEYTPEAMKKAAELDAVLRKEGGAHLLAAAEKYGAERYIVQSAAFWYAQGTGFADEDCPFAFDASPGIASGCKLYAEIEQRILQSKSLQGVALRFGFFYGPRTWFHPDGNVGDQVRRQQFPLIGKATGIWNFVHIEDAALATAAALYCLPGAYNIVNNTPIAMRDWLPAFAQYIHAPHPPTITEEEGLKQFGPDRVYYATQLRGASNAKAKRELNFAPRRLEWLT